MSNQNANLHDVVRTQLQSFLKSPTPESADSAFSVLSTGLQYLDFTAHLLRCLQNAINDVNFGKTDVNIFYQRTLRLLDVALPIKMTKQFMGPLPEAQSELAKRTRLSSLRHLMTNTWNKLFEKELPDDLLLDALVHLGDDQLEKMTDTARLLAPYVTAVFDPPSVGVAPSWSRAVSRTLLKIVHIGGLNFDRLYPRLYELLDDDIITCPYFDRFLVDLDVYLSSLHVPAGWIAAFCKRLAQLSIRTSMLSLLPPMLTLIGECLNRHQMCRVLVDGRLARDNMEDKNRDDAATEKKTTGDPFVYNPKSLASDAQQALKSSLWEITCLEYHYHPEVARLAQRIRQIAGSSVPMNAFPDIKNQIVLGKEISKTSKSIALQCFMVLKKTNARMPILLPMDGWVTGSETVE